MKASFLRSAICMLAISLTVFTSCKKNKDEPAPEPVQVAAGSITLKVDGTKITVPAQGAYSIENGTVVYAIAGGDNTRGVLLTISADKMLSTGSWTYNYPADGLDLSKKPVIMGFATSASPDDVYTNAPNSKWAMNITGASATALKGTFSGEIMLYDEVTKTYKNKKGVTDGAFDVTLEKVED